MIDILLLPAILGLFIYGYFIMGKLDHFLAATHDSIEDRSEVVDPFCIMLTADMPEDTILEEILSFREKYRHAQIILFNGDTIPRQYKTPSNL